MRTGPAAAALYALLGVAGTTPCFAEKAEAPAPPPVGVSRQEVEGAERIDAVVAGPLLSYALPKGAGGRREILMLVSPEPPVSPPAAPETKPGQTADPCREPSIPAPAPPDLPRQLVRLDLTSPGGGALQILRTDLPSDAAQIDSMDLDGDGVEEILLARPGELLVLEDLDGRRAGAPPRTLMRDPNLLPGRRAPRAVAEPRSILAPAAAGSPFLWIDMLGGSRFYGPSQGGLSWDLIHEATVPLEAEKSKGAFRLRSETLRVVGRRPDGAPLFASGPESYGRQRLRTVLVDPAAPSGERTMECWSLLPGAEDVLESRYLLLDGRPALLALTRSADKLRIFEEKMLRLFRLDEPDRSHTGTPPVFAVETGMNLWQSAHAFARDVDGDGREDLVLGYWKGLKDSHVVLELYARRADGSFSRSASTTGFDVEKGDRSIVDFSADFDGDARTDLLVVGSGSVMIYPGTPGGRALVAKKPEVTAPIAGGGAWTEHDGGPDIEVSFGRSGARFRGGAMEARGPRPVDLDGDGRSEILVARQEDKGRGLLQVIRLPAR